MNNEDNKDFEFEDPLALPQDNVQSKEREIHQPDEDKVEIKNAQEEIQELVEKCNKCGLCKELDCVWHASKQEALSSRGKAILLQNNKLSPEIFFSDSLSATCKESCPFDIDLDKAIRRARKILNLKGKPNPFYKEALKKIQNNENPYSE